MALFFTAPACGARILIISVVASGIGCTKAEFGNDGGGSGGGGAVDAADIDGPNEDVTELDQADDATAGDAVADDRPCSTDGGGECGVDAPPACATAAECPGQDGPCATRTCAGGVCGFALQPKGTAVPDKIKGDCLANQCDDAGSIIAVADDTDTPNDGKQCTMDVCQNGQPSNKPVTLGTACTDNGGELCGSSGECIIKDTFFVVRVGDGTAALSSGAAPVFVEEQGLDGGVVRVIALPTAPAGANRRLTQSGTAKSDGALARSADGRFVTLAGYDDPVGASGVVGSSATSVNRVVGRIDAAGNIDTSTVLPNAFDANNVRGAVTADGTAFWVSGANSGSTGGVQLVALGGTVGTPITTNLANVRNLQIVAGQLYGSSGKAPFDLIFMIGSGLPTSTTAATPLLGGFTAGASPEGFVFFDLSATVPGPDTLYVADDRDPSMGGGVQRWSSDGAAWNLVETFGATGFRGLAGIVRGGNVWLIGATADANGANNLVAFVDRGTGAPISIPVAHVDGATKIFRGVSVPPN